MRMDQKHLVPLPPELGALDDQFVAGRAPLRRLLVMARRTIATGSRRTIPSRAIAALPWGHFRRRR